MKPLAFRPADAPTLAWQLHQPDWPQQPPGIPAAPDLAAAPDGPAAGTPQQIHAAQQAGAPSTRHHDSGRQRTTATPNSPQQRRAGPDTATAAANISRVVTSSSLLQGAPMLLIEHNGITYQLRATRQGKLILTK